MMYSVYHHSDVEYCMGGVYWYVILVPDLDPSVDADIVSPFRGHSEGAID